MTRKCRVKQTEHHYIPTSRGGPKYEHWNKRKLPEDIHSAWHTMFANLRAEEVLNIIPLWVDAYGELIPKIAGARNTICWEIVFGKRANLKRAVQIIKKDFTPHWVPKEFEMPKQLL